MQGINDKRTALRKQDVSVGIAALLIALVATLDPDGENLSLALRLVFLGVGALLGGLFLHRILSVGGLGIIWQPVGRGRHRTLLVFLVGVHLVATLFFFPPQELLNPRPVISLDHTFHYYQVARANQMFSKTGWLNYYDPLYMAGYPTAIFDLDMKAPELLCAAFPADTVALALKFFILLCYLSIVFTVYKGSRYLGHTEGEAVLAVMILLAVWHWGRPYASHFRYAGMFDFILVSHVSLLLTGLFGQFLLGKKTTLFFILGPLTFLFHPTAVVILAVPFFLLIVFARHELTMRRGLGFFLWCGAVIVVNANWIVPLVRYADVKTASNDFFQVEGLAGLMHILLRPGCLPALVLMGLSVVGVVYLHRCGRVVEAWVSSGAAAFLLFIASMGIYLPGVNQLEPGRFLLPALFFLAPSAGSGLLYVLELLGRRLPDVRWGTPAILVVLAISPVFLSLLSSRTGACHRLTTRPTESVRSLIEAIENRTSGAGRLMIEDGPAYLYGNSHMPGMLALRTGTEQIGGPYPFAFVKHHYATFQADETMGRPLEEIAPDEMRNLLELYNVLWVVTATTPSADYFERLAEWPVVGRSGRLLERLWEEGRYVIWKVDRKPTFADVPGVEVSATFNRIHVELEGEPDEVLLKYHWDRGLRVEPPAEIAPTNRMGDPVPFILLKPNGLREITIIY